MKHINTLVFILLTASSFAQITVTNATFPRAKDTLWTASVIDPTSVSVPMAGANMLWNYENVQLGFAQSIAFDNAANGQSAADFPQAELVARDALNSEIYYDVFGNRIDELGRGGLNFGFGDLPIVVQYAEKPVFRRAPISYNDVFDTRSATQVDFPADIIPDSLLGTFSLPIDSFRITFDQDITAVVDGWGTINTPIGGFEVLRERSTLVQNTKLFAKFTGTQTYAEISGFILAALGDLADFFGEQTTISYNFYSNTDKEIIASISQLETGDVISATFKTQNPRLVSTKTLRYTGKEISAYPNPTLGPITFQVGGHGNGKYTLAIYNIVGKQISSDVFTVRDGKGFETNIGHLRKGTYIYTIQNENGLKLATKRFMVLKP